MQITFNTAELTTLDQQVIALLAGSSQPINGTPVAAPKPAPAKKAPKPEPKPEEDLVPASSAAREGDQAVAAAAAEPEPVVEEDLLGGDAEPEPEGPTMADAVAAATKLVSSGGAPKVKEALAAVGAKRVSEIPADSIAAFLDALK